MTVNYLIKKPHTGKCLNTRKTVLFTTGVGTYTRKTPVFTTSITADTGKIAFFTTGKTGFGGVKGDSRIKSQELRQHPKERCHSEPVEESSA
ncbi:MAG: hypothetical protein V4560_12480 [Bacteroidota bacterium]